MSEFKKSTAAGTAFHRVSPLGAVVARVVGMSAARVEWGVIIARILLAAGLLVVSLTNERASQLGTAAVISSAIPIAYSPLLIYMVRRGAVSGQIVVSAALDTATVLAGVTWAAWGVAQRVAENAAAISPDQIHQVEHDIYRPMLALVMFVALRLRPAWGAGFVVGACAASMGLILLVGDGAFPISSLAFQYISLAITGVAAVVVAMFIQHTRLELEDALEDRSDLIQTVSHELGNPLAALKASLEMTRDEFGSKLDEDFRRLIRVAVNSVSRIESLAQNLSALRSVDARVEPPRLSNVPILGVVQFAVDSMQPMADDQEVTIAVDSPQNETLVALANHDAVDRILVNLISNAVKYSPRGGHVLIRVRPSAMGLSVDVEDDGPGVPDMEKPMLFNRFFRASNALERNVPGSGLGLFISRELARRMGGDLTMADRPSGGSIFTLSLRSDGRS